MPNFRKFASEIANQFARMSKGTLFTSSVSPDTIWNTYLKSFPEGTNPIFRVRTEYDSVYDRSVLRKIGNAVAIASDGSLTTLWDNHSKYEYPYNVVSKALHDLVKSAPIADLFTCFEKKLGYVTTTELREGASPIVWEHFHAEVPVAFALPGTTVSEARTSVDVLSRSLREVSASSLEAVLELIDGGSLYRGSEHRNAVAEFLRLHRGFSEIQDETAKSVFVWQNYKSFAARFKNTAIGTLVWDLNSGVDEDTAIRAFEAKVAPLNYQRPQAAITKKQVDLAAKTIQDLGLEAALQRRHARLSDVSVNDVLWVDRGAARQMKGVLDDLLSTVTVDSIPKAADISVGSFLSDVLPRAESLEILFDGNIERNLVNITAAVYPDAPPLFKWDSGFAWSYKGGATDTIKQKVKKAGGNIHADIRVSLAWSNYDDLDLHCECPYGHVYYGSKQGILDVDMNAGGGRTREPVENLAFNRPRDGVYKVYVNQFAPREDRDLGFTLEIEYGGKLEKVQFPHRVSGYVQVLNFTVKNGVVAQLKFEDNKKFVRAPASNEVWGIKGNTYVPVTTFMLSPNHWNGSSVGNKHWMFMLANARNPEPVRGIYNEFLRPELHAHRKVFEVLGSKSQVPYHEDQLCGVGFSSTLGDSATFRVKTSKGNSVYRVTFKEN